MENSKTCGHWRCGSPGSAGILFFILFLACGCAAEEKYADYEYQPGQGLHQEEWYDPGDWFETGEGIDYEPDLDDYYYGYDVYDDWSGYPHATYYPYSPHDFYYPEPWSHDPAYYQFYSEDFNENVPFGEGE